jgi:choice-of-anchor C domain-containing protein
MSEKEWGETMRRGLLAFAFLVVSTAAAQAQLTNGSFSNNSCPAPNDGVVKLARGITCISGWTIGDGTTDPGAGIVQLISTYWQEPGGTSLSIALNGTSPGSISQTLNTQPGTTYTVTFALSGDPQGGNPVKTLLVTGPGAPANTSQVYTYDTSAAGNTLSIMEYLYQTFSFTATGTSSTITFASEVAGSYGPVIGNISISPPAAQTYYFSQIAVGQGFQTTLTYVNYSPIAVTCVTNFYSDSGSHLSIPFNEGTVSTRTDTLQPGQSIHDQTTGNLTAAVVEGWAEGSCTSGVQASVLYRLYQTGAPVGEASVISETAPTTEFATFAQTATGVAYANPSSTQSTTVTITAYSAAGAKLGSQNIALGPLGHGSANLGPLLGIQSFTGFVKITATLPIISISLNAEAFPVFSSLPPGDLPASAVLVP